MKLLHAVLSADSDLFESKNGDLPLLLGHLLAHIIRIQASFYVDGHLVQLVVVLSYVSWKHQTNTNNLYPGCCWQFTYFAILSPLRGAVSGIDVYHHWRARWVKVARLVSWDHRWWGRACWVPTHAASQGIFLKSCPLDLSYQGTAGWVEICRFFVPHRQGSGGQSLSQLKSPPFTI